MGLYRNVLKIFDTLYYNAKNKKTGIPPFKELRIENTNLCHYRCLCCLREKLARPLGTMTAHDFSLILAKIKKDIPFFRGNVHLHGYGEPLLDNSLPEKLNILHSIYPKCNSSIFTTLGIERSREYFESLINNGLNNMCISMYSVKKDTYFQIHGFDGLEIVTKNLITLLDIWKCQPTFKIHINPIPIEWYQENLSEEYPSVQNDYAKFFQTINFPFERKIGALKFHNYGNGRSFRDKNKNTCSIVKGRRHRILQITYDCKVIPCCFDYNAAVVWGNLQENSLRDIFNDVSYLNFIKKHHEHKEECFSICKNCDTKE